MACDQGAVDRHFNVGDAERCQCIEHRVDDDRQAPTVPALPAPLAPSGLAGWAVLLLTEIAQCTARGIV